MSGSYDMSNKVWSDGTAPESYGSNPGMDGRFVEGLKPHDRGMHPECNSHMLTSIVLLAGCVV
jgi:hypothetical protein